jgi:hypothetical protein
VTCFHMTQGSSNINNNGLWIIYLGDGKLSIYKIAFSPSSMGSFICVYEWFGDCDLFLVVEISRNEVRWYGEDLVYLALLHLPNYYF